jgi:hypothetical protein
MSNNDSQNQPASPQPKPQPRPIIPVTDPAPTKRDAGDSGTKRVIS